MADSRARATRRRGRSGAASQRLLLALAASALLTAAISLPMAYQAHEARQSGSDTPSDGPRVEVLGSTTIREPEVVTDTLYWQRVSTEPAPLHRATVSGTPRIFLQAELVVRTDFRLDDGPVQTDTTPPFELDDGAPVLLTAGEHSVTATVTYSDGRSRLHQAFFTATG